MSRTVVFAGALGLALIGQGDPAAGQTGALTQLAGTEGCVSEDGTGGACADGTALDGAVGVAVSGDGRHVYVSSNDSNAVAVFARDRRTGALTQLAETEGCVSEDGTGGACANGTALIAAVDVAVSPDGKNVYVASFDSNAVAVFARDRKTGALSQLAGTDGCVQDPGAVPLADCADGTALNGARSVAASPDGKNVYVASFKSNAVAVFARDRRTGALTQLSGTDGCVQDPFAMPPADCADGTALDGAVGVAVSLDGKNVYITSGSSAAVAVFARDRRTGALNQLAGNDGCVQDPGAMSPADCADGTALNEAVAAAVSPNVKQVYVASFKSHAVAVFARGRQTGVLTQLAGTEGCISEDGTGGACADGTALIGARSVVVSRDGKNVYVASFNSNAVAVFARDQQTGALTQLAGTDGCVSEDGMAGACAAGTALDGAIGVAVSRDGKNAYVASVNSSAVAVFARDRKTGEEEDN